MADQPADRQDATPPEPPPPSPAGMPPTGLEPPGGYQPPPGPGSPSTPTNPLAITSLCLGIGGVVLGLGSFACCACFGAIPALALGPAAAIFGHIALRQIRDAGGVDKTGRGMAVAGLVMGYVAIAIALLVAIILVAFVGISAATGEFETFMR